jgi:hypothetical protein
MPLKDAGKGKNLVKRLLTMTENGAGRGRWPYDSYLMSIESKEVFSMAYL